MAEQMQVESVAKESSGVYGIPVQEI